MKPEKCFEEPTLELHYRQLRKSQESKNLDITIVVFGSIKTKKKYNEWSDWMLNCPKGIDYQVH